MGTQYNSQKAYILSLKNIEKKKQLTENKKEKKRLSYK